MASPDDVHVVEAFLEPLTRGDLDGFLAALPPDATWRPLLDPKRELCGRGEMRAFFGDRPAQLWSYGLEILRPGVIVVHGSLRRLVPNGFQESQAWWLCELEDGRVRAVSGHASRRDAERASADREPSALSA